jgi:hypothetical protein
MDAIDWIFVGMIVVVLIGCLPAGCLAGWIEFEKEE